MGFFNWLSGSSKSKAKSEASAQTDIHTSLAGNDTTRPNFSHSQQQTQAGQTAASTSTQASRMEQRRSERNARRELLFQVVRESMVRVGILSSAFRFKVLALDQRGRIFLVMIDLSSEFGGETAKLAEIEAMIAQSAKTRFEVVVQAVYWRFTEAVSSGSAQMGVSPAPAPLHGMPVQRPITSAASPTHLPMVAPAMYPATTLAGKKPQDPIDQAEVEAFKRALAAGTQSGKPTPLAGVSARPSTEPVLTTVAKAASLAAINNKLLLTGYEDTEMHDPDEPARALSATQYGDLR